MQLQDTAQTTEPTGSTKGRSTRKPSRITPTSSAEIKKLTGRLRIWVAVAFIAGGTLGGYLIREKDRTSETIVAVNGERITRDQLFDEMQIQYGPATMHKLVVQKLELQFAAKRGLLPTDEQVQAKYDEIKGQPNYDLILRNSHLTDPQYRDNLKFEMAQDALFSQGITVSDDEVKQLYDQESSPSNPKALFYKPAVSTLQAISTKSRSDAQAVIAQLNNGTPFDILAEKVSIDASKVSGGRLNPLIYGQSPLSHTPALENAVFALRVGQTSDPLNFNNAWWIFRCNEYSPPQTISFDQVQDQARHYAIVAKGAALNGAELKQEFGAFAQSSNLQAFWPAYQSAIERK